jgi:hypothetical protein
VSNEIDSRIQCNRHFGAHLRKQLERRHALGTHARDTLDRMSDQELVDVYLRNEHQGKTHAARQRAEKKAGE